MKKLVIIRHGESEWNQKNLFTGWVDVELSEKGKAEAKRAGELMKEAGLDFDVCYTSYLKRAINTQQIVLKEMEREWLPVIKSWRLNERHYGALSGLNKKETAEKYGPTRHARTPLIATFPLRMFPCARALKTPSRVPFLTSRTRLSPS